MLTIVRGKAIFSVLKYLQLIQKLQELWVKIGGVFYFKHLVFSHWQSKMVLLPLPLCFALFIYSVTPLVPLLPRSYICFGGWENYTKSTLKNMVVNWELLVEAVWTPPEVSFQMRLSLLCFFFSAREVILNFLKHLLN